MATHKVTIKGDTTTNRGVNKGGVVDDDKDDDRRDDLQKVEDQAAKEALAKCSRVALEHAKLTVRMETRSKTSLITTTATATTTERQQIMPSEEDHHPDESGDDEEETTEPVTETTTTKTSKNVTSGQSVTSVYFSGLFGEEDQLGECDEECERVEKLTRFNVSALDYADAPDSNRLLDDESREIYNCTNVYDKIHNCGFSYKLTTGKGKIVAVVCLDEYPNIPAISRSSWCAWLAKLYGLKDVTSYNALWVHLAIYDKRYEYKFLYPLMNYLFHKFIKKLYVLFVIPAHCHEQMHYLSTKSTLILPAGHANHERVQTVRLCVRQDFVTNYKIRRAVEEDNDDLVPLIDQHCKRFVDLYGEYYVAEIITRHPESGRRLIVAEIDGSACAVLCLNTTVNYDELNEAFELHNFTDLYHAETARQSSGKRGGSSSRRATAASMATTGATRLENNNDAIISAAAATGGARMATTTPQAPPPTVRISGDRRSDVSVKSDDLSRRKFSAVSLTTELLTATLSQDTFNYRSILDDMDVSNDTSMRSLMDERCTAFSYEIAELDNFDRFSMDTDDDTERSEPGFSGTGNAFAIEVIAAHSMHRASLPLLLIASFECFPDKDYALLMMPHVTDDDVVQYFVRVSPKLRSYHPHDLYLCHKGQLLPVKVKRAEERDEKKVKKFIGFMKQPGVIFDNFRLSLRCKNREFLTYIVMSGRNDLPVGLVQLHRLRDFATIKQKYALAHRTDIHKESETSYGVIEVFTIAPLFKSHIKFILREIHRKTDFTTLLYAVNRHDGEEYRCRPLMAATEVLTMVPPKRLITHKSAHTYAEEPFTLFVATPRLLNREKSHINLRIVIVGSSYTAVSFIQELQTSATHLNRMAFNNVVLVSKHGLCHSEPPDKLANMFKATRSTLDYDYLEKIGLRCKLTVVTGTLTRIDRKDQVIEVNEKVQINYDYLFLMCGVQYGIPRKVGVKEYLRVKLPSNMFAINTERDAKRALLKLHELTADKDDYTIVVYGRDIDVYCCLAALLEFGIDPDNLILIEPDPPDGHRHHDFMFQDGEVYERIVDTVESMGVTIYTGYKLIDWSTNKRPNVLRFESKTRYLDLQPLAAFIYNEKNVDVRAFYAIYEAGLVYDGRLVINPQFRTNDPYIYAAGPLTKYTKKLWAEHLAHKFFNSEEIGEYLAKRFTAEISTESKMKTRSTEFGASCLDHSKLVPSFRRPLITYCKLPGGMYYLNVCKPGPVVPLETSMSDNDYGSLLATGNCRNLKPQGYFRIHLNVFRIVETITCLSVQKFNYKKLILLWGKHESLLNNMVRRFEYVYITDLFHYFDKPWTAALFHDDFYMLEDTIMRIMMSKSSEPGSSPLEDLHAIYMENGFTPLNREQKTKMTKKFRDSGYETAIQKAIMTFICDNLAVLDMYAHPVIINYILAAGYDNSPLFKKI